MRRVKGQTYFKIVDAGEEVSEIPAETPKIDATMGIGETIGVGSFDVPGIDFGSIKRGEKRFYFLCEVQYGNSINPKSQHLFRLGTYSVDVSGDPEKYWDADNPVDVPLPHMIGFNKDG